MAYCQAEIQELWHGPDATAFASLLRDGHTEHLGIRSRRFDLWARDVFHRMEGRPVRGQAMKDAIGALEALGVVQGREYQVFLRTARVQGPDRIFIDLGGPAWDAVEVSSGGWTVKPQRDLPVRFVRPPGMRALPMPVVGGGIEAIRPFVNLDDPGFMLAMAWVLAALSGSGPYPILALSGEQGSAKSSTSRLLQSLVDPHAAGLRGLVREGQDLFIAARNAHVLCLDNLSTLNDRLADDLCRIASGGSFTTRRLFHDEEEVVITVNRPMILNGIPDLMNRGDLADRSLALTLGTIPGRERVTESKYWAGVEEVRGQVLGGLFTALAGALARWQTTDLAVPPRMADFAKLVVAAEPDLPWEAGAFLRAYQLARAHAASLTLEGDAFAQEVIALVRSVGAWEGTSRQLLEILVPRVGGRERPEGWPRTATAVGNAIRRLAPALRAEGFSVIHERRQGGNRDRILRLTIK